MDLFGTDGIRDRAGEGRLAPSTVVAVGRALAQQARRRQAQGVLRVALGRDARPSGPALVAQLAQGLRAGGATPVDLGLLPTPAVAWAAAAWGYPLALMVSASHNPAPDNGIKAFSTGGRKLTRAEEQEVESLVGASPRQAAGPGPALECEDGAARYVRETVDLLGGAGALAGQHVVVDLAAGATTSTAVPVLQALGARVHALHPAGSRPINEGCGSEHPEAWLAAVRREGAAAGLAFDGDGDRVLVADETGQLLDGDDLLALLAEDMQARGGLGVPCVVATVMSNLGLEERLRLLGLALERAQVGDKHVAERMLARGACLGGEASGHILLARPVPGGGQVLLGDALVAGVRALEAVRRLGRSLSAQRALRARHPQVLRNLRATRRRDLAAWASLQQAVEAEERAFGGSGRVLVRWSGTEPLLRIMVEGRDAARVAEAADRLEAEARAGLG